MVGLAGACPAWAAGTATTTFNVTATVMQNCAVSAADLAFGNYDAGSGTAITASTTLQVTCTPSLSYTVALDGGMTTHDPANRAMTDTGHANNLTYGLYTTSGYGTIWGDGTGGTSTQGDIGNGTAKPMTVYGRIPGSQFVPAGGYSDRVTVTVSY
ncbi:MAG TPA: spore coat U domain-containing protein [Rhizomicrobium sp.]